MNLMMSISCIVYSAITPVNKCLLVNKTAQALLLSGIN